MKSQYLLSKHLLIEFYYIISYKSDNLNLKTWAISNWKIQFRGICSAYEIRNCVQFNFKIAPLWSLYHTILLLIIPIAFWQINSSNHFSFIQHRSHKKIIPNEELVIDSKNLSIIRLQPPDWSNYWRTI